MNKCIVCYVTDRRYAAGPTSDPAAALLEHITAAARAGADWIQLREKDLDGGPLLDLTRKVMAARSAAAPRGAQPARVLINDRLDVALAAGAGGVHLGENSIPAGEAAPWRRQAALSDFLIGVSCHSSAAASSAAAAGADYVFFGPVFATPSKQSFGAPQGLQKLESVCRALTIPVLAIGGITPQNAVDCLQAGAAGIAAIRLFQQAPERVAAAVAEIRR